MYPECVSTRSLGFYSSVHASLLGHMCLRFDTSTLTSTSSDLASLLDDQHLSAHLVAVLLPMDVAPEDLVHVLKLFRVLGDIERQPDNLRGIDPNPGSMRQLDERAISIEPKWDVEQH